MFEFELDQAKVADVERVWLDAVGCANVTEVERIGNILKGLGNADRGSRRGSRTDAEFCVLVAAEYEREYGLPIPRALLP